MTQPLSEQDWAIRLFVYQHFVDHTQPPTVNETAAHFGLSTEEATNAYQRLHDNHTLFLAPATHDILMANPLSAVETPFKVHINGRRLWANCAWDSLGIPAMLHTDAHIEVSLSDGKTISYAIENDQLKADGGLVHFPLPFNRWYDDLIHT